MSTYNNPFEAVNAYKQNGIGSYDFSKNNMGGLFGNSSQQQGLPQSGGLGTMFGGMGLEQLGGIGNIAGGLFGMYNQMQAMDAAKTGMNNQTRTGNYNMANNTNFTNAAINAFGSGQAQSQNQFGKMI